VGEVVHLAGFTTAGPLELTFTVGEDGLPMSDEPLAVEVEAVRRFDGLEYTTLSGTVAFETPRSGLLQTTVVTEGVSAGWVMAGLVDGRRELTFSHDVLGTGREHCVDARLLDETGAVVWEVEGGCASTESCPAEERSRSEDSGCSTTGTAPGGVGLAFALLVGRRRRR
jgi:MYXO-CTERM domain-containing protein